MKAWLGGFFPTDFYFTLHGECPAGPYSLVLSDLPALDDVLRLLDWDHYHLTFYFGMLSPLTPEKLQTAGIAVQPLAYRGHTLWSVNLRKAEWATWSGLVKGGHDFWCLVSRQTMSEQDLAAAGIVAGPAASEKRHPIFQNAYLANYFTDPSLHGDGEMLFVALMAHLFQRAFQRLYGPLPKQFPPLQRLPFPEVLGLTKTPTNTEAALSRSFRLWGGAHPRLERRDWPEHQTHWSIWDQTHWEPLERRPRKAFLVGLKLVPKYAVLVALLPVAILVIPLTLALWLVWEIGRWIQRRWR